MEGMEGMTHNARLLEAMDYLMRSLDVSDDSLEELWLMEGVPDGADEDDYEAIAENPRMREDTEREFFHLMHMADQDRMPICWEGGK